MTNEHCKSGVTTMQRTGAQIIWESLVAEGVSTVFGALRSGWSAGSGSVS